MDQTDQMAGLAAVMPEAPDFSSLPVRIQVGTTPLFGVILMLAGGILPLMIWFVLSVIGWIAEVPDAWFWIKLVFVVIPLAALPVGWWIFKSKTVVEIGENSVRQDRVTPMGQSSWEAPLAEYTGLIFKSVLPSSRSQDRVPRYVVEMQHPDPDKRPRLTHTKDEAMARVMLDNIARLTGLAIDDQT